MSMKIRYATVEPDATATFDFGEAITDFMVGVSYYKFDFYTDDHHVQQIEISLSTNQPSSQILEVKATGIMEDSGGNGLSKSNSKIGLVAVAWTGTATTSVELTNVKGIANGTSSASIPLSTSSPYINVACLSGFDLAFDGDHHVRNVRAEAGVSKEGSTDRITSVAQMTDNGGNTASTATIDGGLMVTSAADVGALLQTTNDQQTTGQFNITFDAELSDAAVIMTDYKVQYESDKDHHVKTLGGGCSGWSISDNDAKVVQLDNAWAFMSDDDKKSQDDGQSHVSLMVIGIKKPTTTT